ncbi:MAG TPA: DUF6130 family protein [Oligoflexus sp.]|uniref:DUF6130 family protein n=1 Tax=Oligoflexus sp. TaxID=1971216 RepID=UPI002D72C736|nr:DUF6130 family protein [Oligoflexus sp.]HYX34731.1 DUF6130 family protein [Oligoflexus sp.]
MKHNHGHQHGKNLTGVFDRHSMFRGITAFAAAILVIPGAFSAEDKQIKEASPYVAVNEPLPTLTLDQPLPEGLQQGLVWIQYRVENVRILPVFGEAAKNVLPRIGHLHVHVDDVPFWWVEASDNNTIDIAGLPVGQHKVKVVLVDANHQPFPGQSKTVTFDLPKQLKQ